MSSYATTEGQLPPAENQRIFRDDIAPAHLDGSTPQRAPVAIIVAGQTGAGKTAVTRMVVQALERRGEAAWINMDFYNPHHPGYAGWQAERPQEADALVRPDGDRWWEQAQDLALSRGYDILLESAMVSPAEYEDICRRIQSAELPPGVAPYRIETAYVAVPGAVSRLGVMTRYLDEVNDRGYGRLVAPEIHDAALNGVVRGAAAFGRDGLGDFALQSFADAVGYSRGTISRFLSGERRPKADFLDKVFAALEGKTGHPVTEEAQTSTRRLYFECIRTTRPHEYQVFELQEKRAASYWEHQAAERLIENLSQDLRETRQERDQIDRERRALEQAAARDAAQHSQLQQRLSDEQSAYDTARNTLNEQIAELTGALRQAERDRDEARQRCEYLGEELRTARTNGSSSSTTRNGSCAPDANGVSPWSRPSRRC